MVKKSSVFEKIRSRMRSTHVRVDDAPAAGGRRFDANVDPDTGPHVAPERAVARPLGEAASARKLGAKEEATVAIRDGFQELASLLRGMQVRTDAQGQQVHQLAERLASLPDLGNQQLAVLERLADRLEQQGQNQQLVLQSVGSLPETLEGVRVALERAAAVDERTGSTLAEFQSHMARIEQSMDRMVDASRDLANAPQQGVERAVEGLGKAQAAQQEQLVQKLASSQTDSLQSLRDAQADQARRLGELVEDGTRTNRAILILLGLVFLGLVVVAGLLATR